MKSIILSVIFLIASIWGFSQDPIVRFSDSITPDELRAYVEKLASPEFEGRQFNTIGEKKAADFISSEFNTFVLKKTSLDYQVNLSIPFDSLVWLTVTNQNATLKFLDDFRFINWFYLTDGEKIPMVYGGYGIDHPRYSDYSGIEVKGKIVAVNDGQPFNEHGINLVTGDTTIIDSLSTLQYKIKVAMSHHAVGIIRLEDQVKFEEGKKWLETNKDRLLTIPFEMVSWLRVFNKNSFLFSSFAEESFAGFFFVDHHDFPDLVKCRINLEKSPSGMYETQLTFNLHKMRTARKSQNVIGFIEGKKSDEVIVLGAHYDHLGKNDNTYFPGADDNASGVAVLLEIAEAFASAGMEGFVPEKSILFACWAGEESGLLGSQNYIQNSPFKLENTRVYLNFDMVGRGDTLHKKNSGFVYALPVNKGAEQLVKEIGETCMLYTPRLSVDFDYPDKREQIEMMSDYWHFSTAGIPSLGFFTGDHQDLHMLSDTPDKLNYPNMANIARLAFAVVWKESGMAKR